MTDGFLTAILAGIFVTEDLYQVLIDLRSKTVYLVSKWFQPGGVTCDLDSDDDFRSGCRTSVTTTDNSPFQDYTHPDDQRARH